MKFDYTIELDNGTILRGSRELTEGENRIIENLPEGKLRSAAGHLALSVAEDEKIFMNGYQTWTYCPELDKQDSLRPRIWFPKVLVDHFGMDRYGDYHFIRYPNEPGKSHGESYCYFRRGDSYRFFASLDERPGYTIFDYDSSSGILTIKRDCQGLRCGGEFHAFDLFLAMGYESEVFDGWFAALNIRPRTAEYLTGYSSWYNRYQNIDRKSITDDLDGCAQVLRPGDLFQIDDGWEGAVGDWLETDEKKFPDGLRPIVDEIHAKGLKAGLWLAPFVCQKSSRIYAEHPDWLLKVDGKAWYCGSNWGGFYSLDIENPAFIDYIERCFRRVFDEWDFDLVKLDFLYGGAPFGTETESRAGRMIKGMELLRRCCGDKLILGCGVPLMPAFGLVDYCRISCDVGLDWNNNVLVRNANRETVSTRHAIGNSIFRRQLNGRAWLNDPDVFFLRDDNIKLTEKQKRTLAEVNGLFGGLLLCSDNMGQYSGEAREYYQYLLRLRNAENIQIQNERGLSVRYELDGKTHEIVVE